MEKEARSEIQEGINKGLDALADASGWDRESLRTYILCEGIHTELRSLRGALRLRDIVRWDVSAYSTGALAIVTTVLAMAAIGTGMSLALIISHLP